MKNKDEGKSPGSSDSSDERSSGIEEGLNEESDSSVSLASEENQDVKDDGVQNTSTEDGTEQVAPNGSVSPSKSSCHKCIELEGRLESLKDHNRNLLNDLERCRDANIALKKNEKEFKETVQLLKHDACELKKTVLNKQDAINNYIADLEQTKKLLAIAQCDYETIKRKLDSYSNSRYVLDHIIDSQNTDKSTAGVGYQSVPPPVRHN